jgi:hypothetical protein
MAIFEGYERRIDKINAELAKYASAASTKPKPSVMARAIDVFGIVRGIQPIAFENACWHTPSAQRSPIKTGATTADKAAEAIGIGLQAFCIPGSVADQREVGLGHGNLAAMLLREETNCFCFLAGHESFAAGKAQSASRRLPTKSVPGPCRLSSRPWQGRGVCDLPHHGFTYLETEYDITPASLKSPRRSPSPTATAQRFAATARTT